MKQIDSRLKEALDELRTIAQSGVGVSLRGSEDGRKGEVIQAAVDWSTKYPEYIEHLFHHALGSDESAFFGWRSPKPVLIAALGYIPEKRIIDMIRNQLKQVLKKKQIGLVSRDLFQALLTMNCEDAVNAVESLFKKPRNNRLVFDFLWALDENPRAEYAPLLVKIVETTGMSPTKSSILVSMADIGAISFAEILRHKSRNVREAAIWVLKTSSESLLTEEVMNEIRQIVENKHEQFILRSFAADVMKRVGLEVPKRFRNVPFEHTSSSIERLVLGLLFPELRPDDWAASENCTRRYDGDKFRFFATVSFMSLSCSVWVWRGCFWDQFEMGVWLDRKGMSGDVYLVSGMCRRRNIETRPFSLDYLKKNLDWVLICLADELVKDDRNQYDRSVAMMNLLVASGTKEQIQAMETIMRFWKVDWDKIDKQGGCKP